MTFKEWFGPFHAAEVAYDQGRREVGRNWRVPVAVPSGSHDPESSLRGPDMQILVSAGYVHADTGVYHLHVGAYHEQWGNDATRYSARELRQLAAAKDYVARWVQGEIADLPAECPHEILELR